MTGPPRPPLWPRRRRPISGLRGRLTATPHRPTGPTRSMAALAGLIDELGWLFQSLESLAGTPAGELCVAENTAAIRAVSTVLRACAAELDGQRSCPSATRRASSRCSGWSVPGRQPPSCWPGASPHCRTSRRGGAAGSGGPRVPGVHDLLHHDADRRIRAGGQSEARRAAHRGGAGPAELAAAANAAAAAAAVGADPLTGVVPVSRRWTSWMPRWLASAEGFTATHADYARSGSATASAARSAWPSRCSSPRNQASSTRSGSSSALCRCCVPTRWAPAGRC